MKTTALLWECRHAEAPGTSFLFGSMHVRDSRAFAGLPPVYVAMEQCEAFAAEFNLDEAPQEDIGFALQLPEGQTLRDLLGDRKYEKLGRVFRRSLGLPLDAFSGVLPFALSNMIDSGLLSVQQNMPLDEYLWQNAKQAGKTMYGIETLEDQLGVLGSIDLAHQAHGLLQLARNLPGHRKQLNRLADLYVQGNVSQLYRASRKSLGKYRKTMLFDRNHKMALRFDEIAKTTTLLAAVGAAHLWGGYGLIRLLKAKGWKCKPVIR